MKTILKISRRAVAALALLTGFFIASPMVFAAADQVEVPEISQVERLDQLFAQLQDPELKQWRGVENKIWLEWSASGSDAMDLLLQRGRSAMAEGDYAKAIEHLTALTDHAPEFAEGWNARATTFFLMEEYGQSIADIQTTLALNPRHFGALAGLGMILERLEQPKNALKAFEAALAVHPRRPDILEAIKRLTEKNSGTSL